MQARDNLARSASSDRVLEAGLEPGDRPANRESAANAVQDWSVRQLFVQRSMLQSQKATQELSTMAVAFDEIRGQLVNNRIDAEDRKVRIADTMVPRCDISPTSRLSSGRGNSRNWTNSIGKPLPPE